MALGFWTAVLLLAGSGLIASMIRMADREGVVIAPPSDDAPLRKPPPAPDFSLPAPTHRTLVRPVVLRMGSPSARAEKSFAFSLSGDDLLLAGPAKLTPGECVYLDIADGAIQARGLVCSETPAGHKTVRLDHVFTAEDGAFERWQAGAALASRSAA